MTALPTANFSIPTYINNQGTILTKVWGETRILYANGSTERLLGLSAVGINNTGDVVVGSGNGGAYWIPEIAHRNSLGNWEFVANLGAPDHYVGCATGINDHNVIVGQFGSSMVGNHAGRYTDGSGLEDLGILPGGGNDSAALAINNLGTIVGYASSASGSRQAIRYTDAAGMQALELLDYDRSSVARSINDGGIIVGEALKSSSPASQAVAWDAHGHLVNLNDWLQRINPDAASHWSLWYAVDINNSNLILGSGRYDGASRAFVLDATDIVAPEPASWILAGIAGLLIAAGYGRRRLTRR
jgi:probable HAF family extracellular repeat protein